MIGQFLAGLAILALMVLGTFAYGFMLADWDGDFDAERCVSTMNSYCGYLGHYKAARILLSGCRAGCGG